MWTANRSGLAILFLLYMSFLLLANFHLISFFFQFTYLLVNGWHAGECYTYGCRITYHCGKIRIFFNLRLLL